jgi:hypothetical protein
MDKALDKSAKNTAASAAAKRAAARLDWRRKMSDHIAYALLVYTGLQIFVTMGALKNSSGSIMPYFALIILVAAIIPGCRLFERHWEGLSDDEAADPELAPLFRRDRMLVWLAAIGLPFAITGMLKGIALIY